MMNKYLFSLLAGVLLITGGAQLSAQTATYSFTGSVQTYTVPAGVSLINIDARGAQGGGINCGVYSSYQSLGGCGIC